MIRAVMGLVPMVSGQVSAWGKPVDQQLLRIGYVPQRGSVDWTFQSVSSKRFLWERLVLWAGFAALVASNAT